ncbi:MAG: histidine kinase [Defluviitaleaceae bacterium]|nr:histidine kinase [Defluviitaleaceae bacterium]
MRLSIFSKIFLVFLLVVSPLYSLSAYFYIWGRNQTREEIYRSAINNINLYISNVESGIERVINTSVQLINNHDMWDIGMRDYLPAEINVFMTMERIGREAESLRRAFEYVEDVSILFPFSGVRVTGYGNWVNMTEEDFERVNDTDFYVGFPFINYGPSGGVYINFSSQYYREIYGEPSPEEIRWIIVTRIDVARISGDIYMFFADGFDQMAFVGDANGLTIKTHVDEDMLWDILGRDIISDSEMGIMTFELGGENIVLAYRRSPVLRSLFVLFVEEGQLFSVLGVYRNWLWIMTATMAGLLVIFTALTRRVVAVPINKLIAAIKQGIGGDLDNKIRYQSNEEFEYIYKQFNDMLKIHRQAIDQLYAQELTIKDTELKMLQYQINPHFLYNTFFTMSQLLQMGGYDDLQEIMSRMGKYFNFITKGADFILLSEEMNFCEDYMGIQTIRFSNRIAAEIEDLPGDCHSIRVPKLIIQPLLENCYKHGLKNKEEGGVIRLEFSREEGRLIVSIEDNGDELTDPDLIRIQTGLDQNEDAETLGIRNVHNRLKFYFGDEYGLKVMRSDLGGLMVEMGIPM